MFTLPKSAHTACKSSSTLALAVTSQVCWNERRPTATTSAAAFRTGSARRPVGTTFASACAEPRVWSCPVPLVPAITNAVLFLRSRGGGRVKSSLGSSADEVSVLQREVDFIDHV